MPLEDDSMMQPMMANPPSPEKQKRWTIIAIVSMVLLVTSIIVAMILVFNSKDKVRACELTISNLELDIATAQAATVQCQNQLEEAGVQSVAEVEASSQTFGFQYPAGIQITRHLQPAAATQPLLTYRLSHSLIETCDECSPERPVTLRIDTYDRTKLDLGDEKYAQQIVTLYEEGSEFQNISVTTDSSKNGVLTTISGEQIGGYNASPEHPRSFVTYIFEADKYVVVAWLDLSGGVDDGIVNFFRETIDTSKIE